LRPIVIYLLTAFYILSTPFGGSCQYTTPGSGLTYTLNDLVGLSSGAVVPEGSGYRVLESIVVAPTDTLRIEGTFDVVLNAAVLLTIEGALITGGSVHMKANPGEFWAGMRFEASGAGQLQGTTMDHGGGLRVLTPHFEMHACTLRYHNTATATGGALSISAGKPRITLCRFVENQSSAIQTPANIPVAPIIEKCHFSQNNTSNANRPQINLGPSGEDTTRISVCVVLGASTSPLTGGIAVASLTGQPCHVVVEHTSSALNRYGLALLGSNIHSRVMYSEFIENNIQNDPMQGGSGLNIFCSGANSHVVLGNKFQFNLWGITLQGNAQLNMGQSDNPNIGPGLNEFFDNENNGIKYALYNNTPNPVWAQENCWDMFGNSTPEEVIFHAFDDAALGEVTYNPYIGGCDINSTNHAGTTPGTTLFPNPTNGTLHIESPGNMSHVDLYDLCGALLHTWPVHHHRCTTSLHHLPPGMYLLRIHSTQGTHTQRIAVQQ
jgi:hypothetical protein